MLQIALFVAIALVCFLVSQAAPIDDYVWRPDENYGWHCMGESYKLGGEGFGWTVRKLFLSLLQHEIDYLLKYLGLCFEHDFSTMAH